MQVSANFSDQWAFCLRQKHFFLQALFLDELHFKLGEVERLEDLYIIWVDLDDDVLSFEFSLEKHLDDLHNVGLLFNLVKGLDVA